MKNKFAKVLMLLTVVVAMVAMLALPAAAVTVTGVDGVEVTATTTGSSDPCITESNGTVTVTATGTGSVRKQTTVTITNKSGSTATISFDYSVSNHDSTVSTIDDLCGADSGSYSVLLTEGATKSFVVSSKRALALTSTATATLSNFKVEAAASESDVTVTYGSLGSVTIDGTTVASGTVSSVSSSSGASFVAVPGSGNTFVAWIDPATNAVLSTSATYQLIPTEATSLRAVFANASAAPVFWADGTAKVFESWNDAVTYASSATNKVITLAANATLAAGDYSVPAGVTVNIPCDAAGTLYTTAPGTHENTYTTPSDFRTLKLASGANITVNGALSLSANMSSQYAYNGMPSGPLPFINMASGSKITVESGAYLYAWGYITGSGSVEVKSGGTVYENFQIADYRGGDATTAMVNKDDTYGVFPFNQYYIQNVEVPMTLHAGAKENGFAAVYVTLAETQTSTVPFIGSENSMFEITSGYVVKDYMEGTGRLNVKICGDVAVSVINMSMKVSLIGTVDIDSSKYVLPISQHLTIDVESGNVTMNQSVAFLPGSELYIREGAKCTLGTGKKIIAYDLDQWLYNSGANGYSGTTNLPYMQLKYVPGGNGATGRLKDALILVDGEIDATATGAAAYTTAGGANIYSTGTGVIHLTPGTETVTYQVITADTDISSWPEIAIQPIVLQDAVDTDVSADAAGTYTYYASTGKWCTPSHRYEDVVTAPTCTEGGYTTHTCIACGESITDTETTASGHSYDSGVVTAPTCVADGYTTYTCTVCGHSYQDDIVDCPGAHDVITVPGKAATCTETGLTDGYVCDRCSEVQEAQEVIPALGHTEDIDAAVAATCTETGLTEGKHCSACGEVILAQEETPALGHTEVTDKAVAATCTETGLTEGKHCSVCGEVILAQEETPALGHTEVTDKAVAATCTATGLTEGKHCSVCGTVTVAQEVVSALGHSYETVTTDPTYTEAGSKIHTCSNCGDVVSEEIAKLANPVTQYNVSLKENIGVNFVMNLAETDVVTVNGVEVTAVDGVVSIDLAAAQMCDEITITVNGLPLEKTYSVKGYADAILADSSQSEYHNLVKAMLVYGAASQNYFGYNTDNLASADVSTAVVPETTTDIALSDNIDGLDFYGASLSYRNKIAVRFYFTADLSNYTVAVDGYTYTTGQNYVEIAGILPQELGNQITVTVTDAAGNVISVSYGPMNYIVRMNAKGSETAKALVQALYGYYTAAEAYIG